MSRFTSNEVRRGQLLIPERKLYHTAYFLGIISMTLSTPAFKNQTEQMASLVLSPLLRTVFY